MSWGYWFKDGQAGQWKATDKNFILRFDDVECEVMFRPLDTPDDIARVLSLEITFAILDEFVQIPREVIEGPERPLWAMEAAELRAADELGYVGREQHWHRG